ncbi:hypothetical protein PBAL39_02650 [Pedobacter sp. BAL39]|uniref:hypothetical protein n=1 Tax=Pedobacter sp. BAL39 TaxID=391596 RepID=UPI0001559263|nr:hypothetical protein [Pedobacter sp. BAL39]EDM34760.1 hypothetical protein PBAL39_02650 [Pedobacter sp. BAL39]
MKLDQNIYFFFNRMIAGSRMGMLLIVFSCSFYSCKKFIEIDPPVTSTTIEKAYKDDASAIAIMTDVYADLGYGSVSEGIMGLSSSIPALLSDESVLFSTTLIDRNDVYRNAYVSTNNVFTRSWNRLYEIIYVSNSVLSNLEGTPRYLQM